MDEERILCQTPSPGKQPTRIVKWKYDLVHKAILKSVPGKGEGLLFKELPRKVEHNLARKDRQRLGSIGWYTTVVKLDMEVKKELKRVPGAKPQHLLLSK